jgi:hypothetical protein
MYRGCHIILILFLFASVLPACSKGLYVVVEETFGDNDNLGNVNGDKETDDDQGANKEIRDWFDYLCSPQLGGRYSGSEGIERAVSFITSVIGESDSLKVDSFNTERCWMKNIIFHIDGEIDSLIVLGAHYDAYGFYDKTPLPGADDNMSGTAVVLSVIKKLQQRNIRPKYSLDLCLFDGEEIGRYGSNRYVAQCEKGIKQYINVDTCGNKDLGIVALYDEKHSSIREDSNLIVQLFKGIKTRVSAYNPKGYTTDCEVFQARSIPFVSIQNDAHTDYLHSMRDDTLHISFAKIEHIAEGLEQYIRSSFN